MNEQKAMDRKVAATLVRVAIVKMEKKRLTFKILQIELHDVR